MPNQYKEKFLSALLEIEHMEDLQEFSEFSNELGQLRARLLDDEFRIAVVGEFSSGKSTFINALLGQDVLQHATTETTATLTRIANVRPDDPRCRTGEVRLQNGTVFQLSDFSELKDYTTTISNKYDVVNEVAEVTLYLPVLDARRHIVLGNL